MLEDYIGELEKLQKMYIDKFVQTKRKLIHINQYICYRDGLISKGELKRRTFMTDEDVDKISKLDMEKSS